MRWYLLLSQDGDLQKFLPHKGSSYGKASIVTLDSGKQFASDIKNAAWFKKIVQWIDSFIDENHTTSATTPIVIPAALAQISQSRKDTFPDILLHEAGFVGSEKSWGTPIFELQMTLSRPDAFTAGITDYGVSEVRTMVVGPNIGIFQHRNNCI